MDKELLPKVSVALQETDMPEELQFDLLEKLESGEMNSIEELMEELNEKNVPLETIEEFIEKLQEEGVFFEHNNYELEAINELKEATGSKNKFDLGEPDLLAQYKPDKPKNRPRPSPFDDQW